MAMGILQKANLVEIGVEAGKPVRLTSKGLTAQRNALELIAKCGAALVAALRRAHDTKAAPRLWNGWGGDSQQGSSLLFEGLKPYPDNWRASAPQLRTLPHFPMVLHRGGYPDGS